MSKSRGNIVRTETILDVLGADALRYFLLREVVFGQDGSFSFDALVQRYNSDLANGIGNLASRTLTMINRYFKGEVPYPSHTVAKRSSDDVVADTARKAIRDFSALFDQFQFSRALETAWNLVATVDKYIVENEPWSLGEKQDDESRARLATVLYTSAEALRIATVLAHPVIPDATAKIWQQMGLGDIKKLDLNKLDWGQLQLGTRLGDVSPVFPRADKSAIERMQNMGRHGYALTFAILLAETIGLPFPASIALVAAGAAIASHTLTASGVLLAALVALLLGDIWQFWLGRFTGWALLGFLCRLSMNPETCMLHSAQSFYKRGKTTLLFAKFIPGINTMAAPLAGSMKMPFVQFLRFDFAGCALYTLTYLLLGYVSRDFLAATLKSIYAASRVMLDALLLQQIRKPLRLFD